MNNPFREKDTDPAAFVASIENRAERIETPCGYESIVWRKWGSGPPVVLFHGAQGSWSHWIRNIDALAQDRTVLAADLPGSGDSAPPPATTMESICDELATGLSELAGDHLAVDIVGFSFGGVVAAWLAHFHPAVVRRIILVDTGGLDTPMGEVELTRVSGLAGEEREAAHRHNLLALMIRHPENVDALALYLQERNGGRARFNPGNLVLPDKLLTALKQIDVPFDAIWGELDQPHPDPAAQENVLRQIRPDMAFRVIADAGHWVMYERPEEFNREVKALLDRPFTA